jgi:hypothetical protein
MNQPDESDITQRHIKEMRQQARRELWCKCYLAYVRSSNSVHPDGAASWADRALREYDDRFETQWAAPR